MLTIEDLLSEISSYNPEEIQKVKRAYEYAKAYHDGQYRQSGEPYIIHPLNVGYILAEMHADGDTVCAGLLHDTIEDTKATKEEIENLFNDEIANLVDGVTKISKMNFSSKEDQQLANTRKIILGITSDVRIIIIKLADRLHNMRTLDYKSKFKQKENAIETIEIFVPLAYYIGAYRIKSELEDLSLRYLNPEKYKVIEEKKMSIEEESNSVLNEMLHKIKSILDDEQIPSEIKVRTKNIYGIYKKLRKGQKLTDIHDLLALKIAVDEIGNCYRTLGLIHGEYHPINSRFKDYICNPKTNMYKSLHTTVFGPDEKLVQTQIRTYEMDRVASFGLTAYWDIKKGEARHVMQEELREKYQFFQSLVEINEIFGDNKEFVSKVKSELFSAKIYVYTTKGEIVELPLGSTPIDFAYKLGEDIGNAAVGVIVNDEIVDMSYKLQSKDRVKIITDDKTSDVRDNLSSVAFTSNAKEKIKKLNKSNN